MQSQVRFNRVPEKVREKVSEALVQSQVRFPRVLEKVCRARLGSTGFWSRFRRRFWGCFGAEPGQVQQGSGEDSGEGLGGFGAEPRQVQQDLRPFNSLRCFQRLASQHASERFVKINGCGCWGYHRSLFLFIYYIIFIFSFFSFFPQRSLFSRCF